MNKFMRRMRAQALSKGVARRGTARAGARRRIDLLGPERLEDRTLLSITASLSSGVLDVQLSAAGDQALIAPTTTGISVSGTGYTAQSFAGVTAMVVQGANTSNQDVASQSVTFGGSGGTIALDAATGTAALDVSGVTSVTFTDVTIDASSGDVNVTPSETTSATGASATSTPQVSISLTGATIAADNITLDATASSSYTNSAPLGGVLSALGVAAAVADLEPSATVTVGGASSVTTNGTGGNVSIAANSTATVNSTSTVGTTAGGSTFNPVDAAVAVSVVNSSAVAQVGGGSKVSAGSGTGTLSITSTNTTTVTTEVDGSGAVGGATAAVTLDNSTSQALVNGGSTASGGTVNVLATTTNTATTSATSTATGGGSNSAIQNILAGQVDPAYLGKVDPPPDAKSTSPAETAQSGGLPLTVAGAVAVTKFTPTTQAYVDSSTVTAGGAINIGATSDNNNSTTADGEATTSNAPASVGVAVAINDIVMSNTAAVESTTGSTTLTAPTISVQATTPAASSTDLHNINATATSGVSGKDVGLAGALALNIVSNTTEASVPSGSTVAMAGNVTFNAQNDVVETATAQPPVQAAGGTGGTLGVGAAVGLNIVNNTTLADLGDAAQLTGATGLTLTAGSSDTVATNASSGASGGSVSISPSAAVTVVNNTTRAQVGTADAANDPLVVDGAFSATATHTALTSTATGASAGSGSAASVGVSIALAFVTDQTTATTGRSLDATGGGVTLEADGSAASLVSSNASASGGPTNSQEAAQNNPPTQNTSEEGPGSDTTDSGSVDGQNAQQRSFADGESGTLTDSQGNKASAGDTKGDAQTPAASTSDGGITVAAAVAVNVVSSAADATVPDGVTITATGPLLVSATNDTGDPTNPIYPANPVIGDTANAWGTDAGTAKVGIGAAVALNLVNASAEATIGQNATINAAGVTVNAGMVGTAPMNQFGANATSGAGASDVGLAGAVAINIVNNTSQALIETGATVDAHGGDVSVTSLNNATDLTYAVPSSPAAGGSLGIGASLAINIISDSTQAQVQDGAALTDAGNVTVTAGSTHSILTWAQNGASGGVAIAGGIAIVIANDPTTASVGTDTQTLNASGGVTIGSSGSFTVNSVADAATNPSGSLGLGASVVVNVAQDSFTAELNRSVVAGGAVSVTADPATASSQAAAIASESGAPTSSSGSGSSGTGGTADQTSSNQSSFAHTEGGSESPSVAAPPSSNSEMSSPSSSASGDSGGSKGQTKVGIAAAVAVNVLTTSTIASIGDNLTVTAGGALTVGTTNQSSALALADGRATTNQNSIGAAVSLNVANATNSATIGTSDTITADGVSVTALMASKAVNDFSTQGLGVAIGTQVGIAGSVGINVITITTTASIGSNSVVTSSGGLTVQAANDETLQNIAFTVAVGSDAGAGAAVNVNVLNNTTKAFLDTNVQANAADLTQVTAESSLNPSLDPVPNSPADTIVATGSSLTAHNVGGSTNVPGGTYYDVNEINASVISTALPAPKVKDLVSGPGIPAGTVVAETDTIPFAGNLTFGSNVVTSDDSVFGSSKPPKVGDTVTGPGILPGTTITAIADTPNGTTVTLSLPVISNGSAGLTANRLVLFNPLGQALTTTGPVTLGVTIPNNPIDALALGLDSLPASAPHPMNFVAGAGASSGGAGIAGSLIINVINQTTDAYIGSGDQINTLAGTSGNVAANSDEGVTVSANETMNVVDWAGAIGGGDDAGIGAALDVNIVTEDDTAYIAASATVDAAQNVEVTASTNGTFKSITAAVGIGGSAGIAGAASIEVLSPTTEAYIDSNATVNATGDLLVQASRQATINTLAGQLSVSGDASVGAAVSTIVDTVSTRAYINSNDTITAKGTSGTIAVLTGDAAGDTTPFSGVAVVAATGQNVQAIVVGGAVASSVGAAGSMAINVLNDTTTADIAAGATVTATDGTPGSGPGVMVTAADSLTLLSTAGALAAGGDAGLGVGADVDSITKNTQAYIATASVTADGDVLVQADSSGNLTSITAAVGVSGSTAIVGSAGVYVLNITTRAFIGDDPSNPTTGSTTVDAGGSILVAASESTVLDLLSGNLSGSGNLSVGVAASVPVITKTTEAFIGAGAAVGALGLGNAINAETGQFTISYAAYGTSPGEATPPSENANLTGNGNNLTGPRLGQERFATPDTESINGLAVTAVNADSLQGVGVSGGASGSVAVNLSGSVAVLTNHTDAYIGSGAQINSSNSGAASGQSVLVAAGNDSSFLGISGALAISGDLSVAPGVVVLVVNNTITASIDDGASVVAQGDVAVLAHSSGDVLAIAAAGAVSGGAAAGGSVAYVGINDTTQANIGDSATSSATGTTVDAGGNVRVDATDDTVAYLVTGALAIGVGVAGIGGAVSIVDLSKTTDAFIGDYATVNAKGIGSGLAGIFSGDVDNSTGAFGTERNFLGVAVQAATSENVTNVAAAGAAGLYAGLAGGVSIELFNSDTSAHVGNDASIDTASLDVAAVNQATNFSFGGGLAGGIAGIAGGVDIGLLNNSTQAYIGNDSAVTAQGTVGVYALSNDSVQTYAMGAAVGVVGLVGSVSVWSIGVPYSAGYTDGNSSDGTIQGVPVSGITGSSSSAEGQTGGASSMVGSLTDPSNNGAGGNTQYISGTVGANQTGVTGSISGDPVASAINATTVPTGTVAFIGSGVRVKAHDVEVEAKSEVSYNGLVGGVAAGAVGIGGSVEIASIHGNTQAYIDQNSTVRADGNVVVDAELVSDTARGTAFAGTAGIVGIGAQVVDIQDTSTESASLNSGVTIPYANQVQVTASSNRTLTAQAIGGDIGGVVLGVGVAIANATGGPSASIGSGAQIGQGSSRTVGSVEVNATANDNVAAKSYGVAAGCYGATAVFADASASPSVQSSVGGNAAITTTGAVQVTAQDTPNVSAKAFGATIALSVGVGAAFSLANASGTTSSSLGQNDAISALSIDVSAARGEDANNDPTAQSSATAGAGGILAGVNATYSQATAGGTVEAYTDSSVVLRAGSASVQATNQSLQTADATGLAVGGLLAIGADVASASSDVTTSAQLGTGANVVVVGVLDIAATGTDQNDASTTAGSGGLIAGDATVGKTGDTSTTSTTVAGSLQSLAGSVDISATNNSVFIPHVDSTNAALAGASGAFAENNDTTSATTTVADGTSIGGMTAVHITSQNTYTEDLPQGGSTVNAGAGGFLNGTAAESETTITGNSDVTIGGSVNINVENPDSEGISNDGLLVIASSLLHTNDQVSLSSGGAVEGAGTDSSLTATLTNNVTTNSTAASPDNFTSNENIGIGTYSTVNAATNSATNTWGILGAVASSSAETTVTSNQTVTLGPDTNLAAVEDINLYAGQDPTPGAPPSQPLAGDAIAQPYVTGLIAVPAATATSNLTSATSLTVGAGDQLESGENTDLTAYSTAPAATAEGMGHGFELGFIPITDGSSNPSASATSSVTMDGSITAGIDHQLDITIPNDGTAGSTYSNTLAANGATTTLATALGAYTISGPSFAPFTATYDPYFNPYNTISNAAADFPDARELQVLEGGVYNGEVGAIVLGPLFAAGGDVTVNSGSVQGSGSIAAYGGPTINITNNSPDYLVLSSINVPFEPGGQIFFDGGASRTSSIALTQSGSGSNPVVDIQETYDSPVPSSSNTKLPGPSVFATAAMDGSGNVNIDTNGFINNEGGEFDITVADGSFVQAGALDANEESVDVPHGIYAVTDPNGLAATSQPASDWNQAAFWPGSYDPFTNGNTPTNLAAVYVAYVANVLYNSGGEYTTSQAFTAALIGHAGETPYSLDPGQYDYFGYGNWPASASSLVFFGADAPWLQSSPGVRPNQDTNSTASSLSPADGYYTISGSANDGNANDNAEGIFPLVPVEWIPTTTAASYPTPTGTLTSGSEVVTGPSSIAGMKSGEYITGPGIQPGTTIQVSTTTSFGEVVDFSNEIRLDGGTAGLYVGDSITAYNYQGTITGIDSVSNSITISGSVLSPQQGTYEKFTISHLGLSAPATASGFESFTVTSGPPSITAEGVLINAEYIDISEPMNVGNSDNQSISLPSYLNQTISNDQLAYSEGSPSTVQGDAPGFYTLPTNAVLVGDTPITAQYDAITGQIVLNEVNADAGGFVLLDGGIMSTSTFGEINVGTGLGQVTVDNQTSYPIVINNVTASTSAGTTSLTGVDIIDTNQPAATEQTLYVYQPGNVIDEYQGTAGETQQQLQQGSPASVIYGNSTSYSPESGLRYEWQLQATMDQPHLDPGNASSAGWGFVLHNGVNTQNNPWYYLTTPNGDISNGSILPTGWTIVDPGLPAFEESVSAAVMDSKCLNIYYHSGHYGFAPTDPTVQDSSDNNEVIDPWTYLFATQAELTLTESVAADNTFGIDFSGPSRASININSSAPVVLDGSIANPAGSTTISAPSITQSTSATLAADNLTLTSTGGVGTSTQPLALNLTSGGVLNIQAGSQGVYVNLGTGAQIGQIAAGNATSGYGDVVLDATGDLQVAHGLPLGAINVTGNNVTLGSSDGAIATPSIPMLIQAQGVVNASALKDVNLTEEGGNLLVGQIVSTSRDVQLDVPDGSIIAGPGSTWLAVVDSTQSQQIWSNLSLTNPTGPENQTVTSFENEVDANSSAYWELVDNGSVQNGVFTLNSNAVSLYTSQAAAALGVASPTTAQVQAYANSQYQSLVGFLAQNLGTNWAASPWFQAYDPNYAAYWGLVDNGSVQNGVFTLNSNAVPLYTSPAAVALGVANPTTAQVQAYASSQYQSLVSFFAQNLGTSWATLPEFQTDEPPSQYVATAQQVAALESGAGWTTGQLMNPIAEVALNPQDGTPVGITTPNISGRNITLTASGSVGQTNATITIPLADVQSGNLTAAQQQALADATAPGDITVTSTGIEVSPAAQVFMSASGALIATAGGSVTVQSTAPDITLHAVDAGGPVNIAAPGSIFGTGGSGTAITTSGSTVVKAGTGTLGTTTSPLTVQTGGSLSAYAPAGNSYLKVNGLSAIPVTLNAVEGQPLSSAVGSPIVVAHFADYAANGNVAEFTATINWGDGTPETTGVISYNSTTQQFAVAASADHVYTTTGNYTVAVTIQDILYSTSVVAASTAVIQAAELELDPATPGAGMLAIGGTTGSNDIVVSPGAAPGETMVTLNGTVLGPFDPTSRIVIFGQGGNDHYEVDAPVTVPVFINANKAGTSSLTVVGDGSSDAFTVSNQTVTVASSLAGNTPQPIAFQNIQSLTIDGGSGNDLFTIAGTEPGTTTQLNTGTGTDTIDVQAIAGPSAINVGGGNDVINVSSTAPASTGTLSGIAATLTVDGGGTLNLSDAGDSNASTSTLTGTTLTSTAFGTGGSLSYTGLGALNVSMGSGGNLFTVAGTEPGTTTTVNSGTGSDTVNVQATSGPLTVNTQAGTDTVNVQAIAAPASINAGGGNDVINVSSTAPAGSGLLSGIAGLLSVDGGPGNSTLNISDAGDGTASTSTLTATTFGSTALGGSVDYTSLGALNIAMGSGGNNFTIAGTATGTTTTLDSGTGSDAVNIAGTSSPLTVNTQAGTDTVNVQAIAAPASINAGGGNDTVNVSSTAPASAGVLAGIAATLTVDGGTGSSTLNISDSGDTTASTSTLNPSTFTSTALGGSVAYTNLAAVNVSMGSGGNLFTIAGTAPGTATTLNSGTGSDTVDVTTTSSPLTVNTQTGTDTVNVQSIGAPASINAGGSNDVINVSSTAPGSAGVLSGIAATLSVNGGTGSSTLNLNDTSDSTASTSTLTSTTFGSTALGGSVDYTSLGALNIEMGSGGNNFTIAGTAPGTTTTVDSGTGSDTVIIAGTSSPLAVNTQTGTDTVNVQAIGAVASINAGGGNDVINVSSTAPAATGVLSGIAGLLTVNGGTGSRTLNISDAGDTTASTSTLTPSTFVSTAFGTGGSLSYSSVATLNLLLGSGGSTGNLLNINVPAGQNLPATTNLTGGSAGLDTLAANWVSDFNGTLNEQGFATSTVAVGGNFNGSMTAENSGVIASIAIGGSLTPSGVLKVVNSSDPASPTTTTGLLGDIGTMTVGGSIAGLVQVSGNITTLDVGPVSTATAGDVNDVSGQVLVGGQLTTASVSGNVSGSIVETLTINSLYIGGSLTQSGLISAVNTVNPALGNINTLTIGKDLDGTLIVSGTIGTFNLGGSLGYTSSITLGSLGSMTIHGDLAGRLDILGTLGNLTVDGGTPGTIEAGQIGTIGVHGGYGPIVARIEEAGIQRLIEAAVPSAPFPTPPAPPAPTPAVSPAGVTFQYFYEGLDSPTVEGLSPSTNLANPQATIQVHNATGSTAADQFDLSLVTYNDTAKFNLARLDASGNSGVSGIRNVAVEGDILTGVTAAAAAFFASDSNPAGVDLPQDHLAGVAVRDFLPNSSIRAATIQAVAFGSHAEEDGTIITGAQSTGEDAQETLAPGTLVVQANDTFRVPFADLATEQSQLFVDTSPIHGSAAGSFDYQGIVLEVQSVVTANASGTANVVTQSNAARGAVTALITLVAPGDSGGNPQDSVVQAIELYGDGGSIQTALPFASASTITSTGPLGDLLLQGTLTSNVTAPSIFGSIIPQGGAITGTIQTTGIRTDPITGLTSSVPANFGRVYVNTTGTTPVLTSSIVRSFGPGLSGRIISRGNLLSQVVSDGGISGVIAVQGNVGTTFTYPSGQVVRINSGSSPSILSNGPFSGQMIVLGNVIGDVTVNGGMQNGQIAVQGSILGNLTIHGVLDGASALVAGGSIGSTAYGTALSIDNIKGIVAAGGSIIADKVNANHALFYEANDTPDEAVIDAIFSQGVSPLSTSDLFDQTTPEDLVNLTQMQVNLKSLTVKNGKLVL